MEVIVLGCGSATPTLYHLPSCQIVSVNYGRRLFMIDCGEGAQLEMRRRGLSFHKLTDIFISHMHGDHCLGLPGLLSTLSLQDKGGKLRIHLPAEGVDIMKRIFDYFCGRYPFDVELIPLPSDSGTIIETSTIRVDTFRMIHGVPSHGFRISEKPRGLTLLGDMLDFHNIPAYARPALKEGKDWVKPDGTVVPNALLTKPADPPVSYSYCSDTSFNPAMIPHIEGSTLLYHESTYCADMADQAASRGHSTTIQAATIARDANVGQLMIGHYSKRFPKVEPLLEEARQIFPNTIAAYEGLRIKL